MAVIVQLGNATEVDLRVVDSEAIHHATGHSGQQTLQQIIIQRLTLQTCTAKACPSDLGSSSHTFTLLEEDLGCRIAYDSWLQDACRSS